MKVYKMKKFVFMVAGVIIIGFIIMTISFYKSQRLLSPPFDQTIDEQNGDGAPLKPKQTTPLQPHYMDEKNGYALTNNQLKITFDKGGHWVTVPVKKDQLFKGEYNGNEQELIENSYVLTAKRAAFLYSDGSEDKETLLIYTLDQGKTWQRAVVEKDFPGIRIRKVAFLNDRFGYVILTGYRTMSQEGSNAYLTYDGGKTWHITGFTGDSRLLSDGGFIDESTGFMSYGTIDPEEPDFHVTQDGGKSWKRAEINIPAKYHKIFVTAEIPKKEGDHLVLLVNQGPNGDYKGGKVKGKFISKDNGLTWEFSTEVGE